LAALLCAIGLTFVAVQAQSDAISLAAYRARLVAVQTTLAQGDDGADTLAHLPPVQLASGETVAPAPLFPAGSEPDVALARVSAAIEQIDLSRNDDTAQRLAQLERVSARLDLLQPGLWERFLRWLWMWIKRLLPDRGPVAGGVLGNVAATLVGWAAIAVGGLLLVLLLSYWLRRLLAGLLAGQVTADPLSAAEGLPATAVQARQQATQLAAGGNYREAVRRLYLAALLRLRERDLIRFDNSQTNREVLAAVDEQTPARVHLAPVVETFDRVWYGEQEPDAASFHAYSREIDALLAEGPEARRD